MTNNDLVKLNDALKDVGKLTGIKFCYAVAQNRKMLDKKIDTMYEVLKDAEEKEGYKKFKDEHQELLKENTKKDKDGQPVQEQKMINGQPVMVPAIENAEEVEKEFEKLKVKYKKEIDAHDETLKEFEELMKQDVEFSAFKVKLDDVPKEVTSEQMTAIFEIIK